MGRRSWQALAVVVIAAAGAAAEGAPPPATPPPAPPPPPPVAVQPVAGQKVGVSGAGEDLSGDAKSSYDQGFNAWLSGDLQAAKTAFGDAVRKAPGAGSPHYSLGCVLERLGDTQGALDAYRAAFGANAKFEPAMGSYAVLLAQTGRGLDAEQFLAGKAGPGGSPALMTYQAEVKSIEGDSPGCQLIAQQALAKQPDFKDAMIVIARDYYRNHRWDLARYALQAILEGADDGSIPPRDKGNGEALLLRGLIGRETGQRKQALADFEQAARSRPDLFEAYINLGEMKLEAGNASEAQGPLEKAVRYAPNVAVAHLDLGDCYRLLGRPGDAKSELDRAISMDSTLAGVHYDLGLLYLFSPSVPGASGQDDQIARAIRELETYRSMRNAKTAKGQGDDVDELLSTAKRKQSELQLKKQAAAAPAPAASAAPPPPGPPAPAATTRPRAGTCQEARARRQARHDEALGQHRALAARTERRCSRPAASDVPERPPHEAHHDFRPRARRVPRDACGPPRAEPRSPGREQAEAGPGGPHRRRDHDRGPRTEADRSRRRRQDPAQAHPRRAPAALPRPHRGSGSQRSVLTADDAHAALGARGVGMRPRERAASRVCRRAVMARRRKTLGRRAPRRRGRAIARRLGATIAELPQA